MVRGSSTWKYGVKGFRTKLMAFSRAVVHGQDSVAQRLEDFFFFFLSGLKEGWPLLNGSFT